MIGVTHVRSVGFTALVLLSNIGAANDQNEKLALNNLQSKLSQCSVYYALAVECMGDNNLETKNAAITATNKLNVSSIKIGREAGMSDDAMLSRAIIHSDQFAQLLAESCTNFSSAIVRYGETCRIAVKNPIILLDTK